MQIRLLVAAALTALPLSLPAQTFVVDASNGPGTNFTDLPTAVAAVPDGAILLVRPGTYGPVALDGKGLSILAAGPGFAIAAPGGLPVAVLNLGPRQAFTLRGATMGVASTSAKMLLRDCAGPVLVDDYTYLSPPNYSGTYSRGIAAERCAQVSVRNSRIRAYRGIDAVDSDVVIENCDLTGNAAFWLAHIGAYSGTGVHAGGGSVTLSRCRVTGGDGLLLQNPAPWPPTIVEALPAIQVYNGELRLTDDASGTYAAGQLTGGGPVAAIGGNGTVVRDPSPVLTGSNGGPAIGANVTDVVRPLPSLRTVSASPGGTVTADVTTPFGEIVLLAVALPGAPTTVPGIDGAFWLSPVTARLVAVGVPQAGAPVSHAIAVPNLAFLVGARFAWQAVAWSAADGFRVSNPSIYAH